MRRSTDRILTTHTGSLPRPQGLRDLLTARETGQLYDPKKLGRAVREAVANTVRKQIDTGLDVINDGEMSKFFYATYIKERLTGFGGESVARPVMDTRDFPEYTARINPESRRIRRTPACNGPVAYQGEADLKADLDNLKAAVAGASREVFMSAASPGVVVCFLQNQHYPDDEAYVHAVAEAMKHEYDAIHAAGFLLQLDCPDLAMGRHFQFADADVSTFKRQAEINVAALNHAIRDIPADAMRMHLCWGNYEGPHHCDVDLAEIIDIVLAARPCAISLEGANPRHGHEWAVFEGRGLPDGKLLIPGVIDSTTNYIEHPDLVAERICRYAAVVGRENVIAGVDCGLSTSAVSTQVDPKIAWAKLASLVEGAKRASAKLWS
jgi:5-methyltetrahydropteroyltriglutamate--homocysteine methyltransferase